MSVIPELSPTDFKEKSSRSVWGQINHKAVYFGSVVVFGTVIAAIYSSRGIFQCLAIAGYVMSLTLMSVSIRNCFVSHSFNYPQWLVVMHGISTSVIGGIIMKYRENTGGKKIEYPTLT